jgi:hypothetical protein
MEAQSVVVALLPIKVLLDSHKLPPIGMLLLPKLIYLVSLRQERTPDQVSDSQV